MDNINIFMCFNFFFSPSCSFLSYLFFTPNVGFLDVFVLGRSLLNCLSVVTFRSQERVQFCNSECLLLCFYYFLGVDNHFHKIHPACLSKVFLTAAAYCTIQDVSPFIL
jgi:hypothetical protein